MYTLFDDGLVRFFRATAYSSRIRANSNFSHEPELQLGGGSLEVLVPVELNVTSVLDLEL